MLARVYPALKNPVAPSLCKHLVIQLLRPDHAPSLSRLALSNGLSWFQLGSLELQHVRDAQTGAHTNAHDQRVGGHHCREYVPHLGTVCVAGSRHSGGTLLSKNW